VRYMLPAVLALTVMGSFWGLSVQLVNFREQGILRRFRLTPVGAAAIIGSGLISNYVLVLPTLTAELLLARWIYGVTEFGNLWGVFVLITLGTLTFAALGLIVASATNTMQETQVINNAIWFVFLFLSGATIPLPILPEWIQRVGLFLPATHLVTGFQNTLVGGESVAAVGSELLVLAAGLVTAFVISTRLFRWEPEEKVTRRSKFWAVAAVIPFLLLGVWENVYGTRLERARQVYESVREGMPRMELPRPAQDPAEAPTED
jgi:ABC-2 type transport system permease protein